MTAEDFEPPGSLTPIADAGLGSRFLLDDALHESPVKLERGATFTGSSGRVYTLDNYLDAGGAGIVWWARSSEHQGQWVVVKFLGQSQLRPDGSRFLVPLPSAEGHELAEREFQRSRNKGAHVVEPLDHSGRRERAPFLVTPYVPGTSLYEQAAALEGEALDEHDLGRLIQALGDAIWHLHDHRTYHGDIWPKNVLRRQALYDRDEDARYLLIDLGHGHRDVSPVGSAQRGFYVTPEFLGGDPLTHPSHGDIHQAGQTILFALTGNHPTKPSAATPEQLNALPDLVPGTASPALRALLRDMLIPDVKQRVETMSVDEFRDRSMRVANDLGYVRPSPGLARTRDLASAMSTAASVLARAGRKARDGAKRQLDLTRKTFELPEIPVVVASTVVVTSGLTAVLAMRSVNALPAPLVCALLVLPSVVSLGTVFFRGAITSRGSRWWMSWLLYVSALPMAIVAATQELTRRYMLWWNWEIASWSFNQWGLASMVLLALAVLIMPRAARLGARVATVGMATVGAVAALLGAMYVPSTSASTPGLQPRSALLGEAAECTDPLELSTPSLVLCVERIQDWTARPATSAATELGRANSIGILGSGSGYVHTSLVAEAIPCARAYLGATPHGLSEVPFEDKMTVVRSVEDDSVLTLTSPVHRGQPERILAGTSLYRVFRMDSDPSGLVAYRAAVPREGQLVRPGTTSAAIWIDSRGCSPAQRRSLESAVTDLLAAVQVRAPACLDPSVLAVRGDLPLLANLCLPYRPVLAERDRAEAETSASARTEEFANELPEVAAADVLSYANDSAIDESAAATILVTTSLETENFEEQSIFNDIWEGTLDGSDFTGETTYNDESSAPVHAVRIETPTDPVWVIVMCSVESVSTGVCAEVFRPIATGATLLKP